MHTATDTPAWLALMAAGFITLNIALAIGLILYLTATTLTPPLRAMTRAIITGNIEAPFRPDTTPRSPLVAGPILRHLELPPGPATSAALTARWGTWITLTALTVGVAVYAIGWLWLWLVRTLPTL